MSRLAFALLAPFVLLAVLAFPADARACSCVQPPPPAEALAQSGSVLEGRVTAIRHEPAVHRITATLEVRRRWKGARATTVKVVTIDEGSMCGFTFQRGKSYLLYTEESEGVLSVSRCSRSRESAGEQEEIAALDRAVKAKAAPDAPSIADASADAAASAAGDAGDAATADSATSPPAPAPTAPTAPTASAPRGGGCAGCAVPASPPSGTLVVVLFACWLLATRSTRRRR